MMKHILNIKILLAVLLFACFSACEDDFPQPGGEVKPGFTKIDATLQFENFTPALDRSRADGNAVRDIKELWMLFYDKDGNIVKTADFDGKIKITGYKTSYPNNTRPDGTTSAEINAPRAEYSLTVPNGDYRIYAVANRDLSKDDVSTIDKLKAVDLVWNSDISKNCEMLGYFAPKTATAADGFDAPVSRIEGGQTTLHAWVKRAASKLTIAYNGTNLKDGVIIYIKRATIKDIPKHCSLGADNRPGEGDELIDGESLVYYSGDKEPTNYDYNATYPARVAKGSVLHILGMDDKGGTTPRNYQDVDSCHFQATQALFFYENRQPAGEKGTMSDKRQDVTGNNSQVTYPGGVNPGNDAWKDARPYGTYVEIEAFYVSINPDNPSSGDIIYRFMLGKDETTSYDVERNHHYKLTLNFNGWANNVDFHIDYKEEVPGPEMPNPYYISYLYNQDMYYPYKVNAGSDWELEWVEAEIIENHWYPTDAISGNYEVAAQNTPHVYYSDNDVVKKELGYDAANKNDDGQEWNGFLSLRKTGDLVVTGTDVSYAGGDNKKYYFDHRRYIRKYNIAEHITAYDKEESIVDNIWTCPDASHQKLQQEDKYLVKKIHDPDNNKNDVYLLQIPMYTRAKQLIKSTGYSGNNPYTAYQRNAIVKFTGQFRRKGDHNVKLPYGPDYVDIIQDYRIVNPKGIYRSWNKTTPFQVTLKHLPKEEATTFMDVTSEGVWRAYVVWGSKDMIKLDGKNANSVDNAITGETGSKIDFKVTFNGMLTDKNQVKCCIIQVDYHNNSCHHLIFVRQGYAPIALVSGGKKWHSFNMRSAKTEAADPCDEGSLFRRGFWKYPIDATSNNNDKSPWVNVIPSDFKNHQNTKLRIAGTKNAEGEWTTRKWSQIPAKTQSGIFIESADSLPAKWSGTGKASIASLADYSALYKAGMSGEISQGYGVLYSDNADHTMNTIDEAFGYVYDSDDPAVDKKSYGMRGTFVYNKQGTLAGRSVFFPIGHSGYGHRKNANGKHGENVNTYAVLRYAAGRGDYYLGWGGSKTAIKDRPLFWDLYRRQGAIYWINQVTDGSALTTADGKLLYGADGKGVIGWDFNYHTFDFYPITYSNLFYVNDQNVTLVNTSDACFIRCVE